MHSPTEITVSLNTGYRGRNIQNGSGVYWLTHRNDSEPLSFVLVESDSIAFAVFSIHPRPASLRDHAGRPAAQSRRPSTGHSGIGAGLSGLVAAHRLVEAEVTDVVVLEASDRVGGRTLSHRLADGTTLDVGGQWAARAHTRLLALAAEMGVPALSI